MKSDKIMLDEMLLQGKHEAAYKKITAFYAKGHNIITDYQDYFRDNPDNIHAVFLIKLHPGFIQTLACYANNTMLEYWRSNRLSLTTKLTMRGSFNIKHRQLYKNKNFLSIALQYDEATDAHNYTDIVAFQGGQEEAETRLVEILQILKVAKDIEPAIFDTIIEDEDKSNISSINGMPIELQSSHVVSDFFQAYKLRLDPDAASSDFLSSEQFSEAGHAAPGRDTGSAEEREEPSEPRPT